MAFPRGQSMPKAINVNVKQTEKYDGREINVFRTKCTICCMRESVYISYPPRILPGPMYASNTRDQVKVMYPLLQLFTCWTYFVGDMWVPFGGMVTRPVQGVISYYCS